MMRISGIVAMVVMVILSGSCAPSRDARIARNAAYFQTLAPADQDMVRAGKIRVGMARETVELALGKPDRVGLEEQAGGKSRERWTYLAYQAVHQYRAWPTTMYRDCRGRPIGYIDHGPDVIMIPYPRVVVDFQHGVVSGWQRDASGD